jgi:hypothetical protein
MILLIKGEQKAVTRRILTIGLKGVNKFGPQTIFMLVIGKVAKWLRPRGRCTLKTVVNTLKSFLLNGELCPSRDEQGMRR